MWKQYKWAKVNQGEFEMKALLEIGIGLGNDIE